MTDPNYPERPNHPDFWVLSRIIIDQDKRAEGHAVPFEEMIARVVDVKSVTYMASQRALRAAGAVVPSRYTLARLQAVWLDAFLAGAAYQAEKDRR